MAEERSHIAVAPTRARRRAQRTAGAPSAPLDPTGSAVAASASQPERARQPRQERQYVDVSVIRIQSYIARTSDLRGLRGASAQVSLLTDHSWWSTRLPIGAEINPEAGDIDGVISLRITRPEGEDLIDTCSRLAVEVVAVLREGLPAAHLTAVTASAPTYVEAYHEMKQRRETGNLLVDAPPPPTEVVLATRCDRCRTWPATVKLHDHTKWTGDKGVVVCRDCLTRYPRDEGVPLRRPRAEIKVADELIRRGVNSPTFPKDFDDLASREHLALIYADGNGIASFVETAIKAGVPAQAIAPAIDSALVSALVEALSYTESPLPGVVPAIPHILGGDDLQVTVPATAAWRICIEILTNFRVHALAQMRRYQGESVPLPLLSMSAGLVFFRRTTAWVDVAEFAAEQLALAKSATRGKAASIAFLDTAVDGDCAPPCRPALALSDLVDLWSSGLGHIANMPGSHRATVLELLRRDRAAEARDNISRHGSIAMLDLENRGLDLRTQLEVARWWSA